MSQADRAPSDPSAPNPAALLAQARDGDVDAFEALAAARLVGSWQLARAILGSDVDASDALANTLLAAWRELPRLGDPRRFDEWLDRILISECRMRLVNAGRSEIAGIMPPDLLDRTMEAVRASPPRPAGAAHATGRAGGGRGSGAWGRAGVAVVAVLVVAAFAVVVLGFLPNRGGTAGLDPSASPSTPGEPTATTSAQATASPGATIAPGVDAVVRVGTLAMVTLDGDNLRVRSAPRVDDASKRLKPLLPAGTRLLVVGGPVEAATYTWWEIQTDGELIDLFGWVAAADGDIAWISPTAPRCFGAPDADAVTGLTRIDFLACYGDTDVRVQAEAAALWEVRDGKRDCGWVRKRDGCDVAVSWLLLASTTIRVRTEDGVQHDVVVAVPPDLAAALATLPRHQNLTLTLSMDSPESQSCSVRDSESGALLIPADRAVTGCRLQFVIQEVAFRQE